MLTARCLYFGFCHACCKFQKEHVHLIHYPLYTTIRKPCNYLLSLLTHSSRPVPKDWVQGTVYWCSIIWINFLPIPIQSFPAFLHLCLFFVCLLFVVCLFVVCLFVCLFVVEHTDDYSCIAIKTSANQISCYWNTSSQSHPTFFTMWRKKHLTWLSNSAGLILAKRRKSMMVNCLAISSGSKSNKLRTEDKLEGNCKRNKHAI